MLGFVHISAPQLYALALPKDVLRACAQRCKPWFHTLQGAGILGITETQANTYKLLRKEDRELVRLEDRASRIQGIWVHPSGLRHSEVAIFKPTKIFHSLVCPSPLDDTSRHGIDIWHDSVMKGSWVQVQMKTPRGEKTPTREFYIFMNPFSSAAAKSSSATQQKVENRSSDFVCCCPQTAEWAASEIICRI